MTSLFKTIMLVGTTANKDGRQKPVALCVGFVVGLSATSLAAQTVRGVTATEIKIGQTMPYSGPVSAFGALGKGEVGYFKMIDERGGINGARSI